MKIPFAQQGLPYLLGLLFLTAITYFFSLYIAAFFLFLALFVLYFFRDPERRFDSSENLLLSPADGRVMSILEINEEEYIRGKAIKVSIFLSLFNVHINRIPVSGTVTYQQYRPGKMLPAFKSHASELNERNTIGVDTGTTKILVRQITGLVARRIVWWVKPGDKVKQGERFGLIKFGSCTEIIVPKDQVEILVRQGDKVVASQTVIGRLLISDE